MDKVENIITQLLNTDILKEGKANQDFFVGRPFYVDYSKMNVLISDAWKFKAGGIPQGAFLLAFYTGEAGVEEALLLRALGPTTLPNNSDVISSMIEYYKDAIDISGREGADSESKLDTFTRYEFSFSGLECRILGTFYRVTEANKSYIEFGADTENFYSANNYEVYKATGNVLKYIVNLRGKNGIAGSGSEFRVGKVRYSSSRRFQQANTNEVEVYINPKDFLGKRSALFGMTRTGKSNTVKKIIQATFEISQNATNKVLPNKVSEGEAENYLNPFDDDNPKFKVGQIIFDINGEYANKNLQDEGTAIFDIYQGVTERYSVLEKPGFKIMKVNFYREIEAGLSLINSHFADAGDKSDYINNFLAVNLEKPEDYETDIAGRTRYDRKVAAYQCCLKAAGFKVPDHFSVKFKGNNEINKLVRTENIIDPSVGISIEDAIIWFTKVWLNSREWEFFRKYDDKNGKPWIDEELQALLVFLTKQKNPGKSSMITGYNKLKPLIKLHTHVDSKAFEEEITENLRDGKIVIIDLSQGDSQIQHIYSDRICVKIFQDSLSRFTNSLPNNFIQFYFEEAHNLFPQKDDKDLSQIYNRLAKEGAKLGIGMTYATQEVSSISTNILKNTQNWFIAHLNNEDELKELRKYYDFSDFADSLIRFSADSDKGFIRMKTYTNPFVVPVQIDRFLAKKEGE